MNTCNGPKSWRDLICETCGTDCDIDENCVEPEELELPEIETEE